MQMVRFNCFTYSKLAIILLFVLCPGGRSEVRSDPDSYKTSHDDLPTLVTTKQGSLEGISLTSRRGRTYYGWLGIPFGKIKERFAAGERADSWDGVKDAKILPPPCFQYFVFFREMIGIEDCLLLNVYSPKPKVGEKMAVFVWFTPGGFQIGGASMFEAKYIMDQDVVFISINFRLGALGFLNTGDGTVSGNNGLKDAVLALQWVQENAEYFGGDPNLVTIFGLSAGGATVDYLTISPMAKGLFHRAIAMSGSSLNPWAFQANPIQLAEALVENAGCFLLEWGWPEKVACLRSLEPTALVNAQLELGKLGFDFDFIHMKFVPSVESDSTKSPRFLVDSPFNLLSRGEIANKVPMMAGHTENEGSFYVAFVMNNETLMEKLSSEWSYMAPYLFYYEDSVAPQNMESVSEAIHDFYIGGGRSISSETKKGYTDIYSDRFFANGIAKGIQLHASHQQPVFPYILDYQGQYSLIQFDFGVQDRDGVGHADDMMYLFNATVGGPEILLGTKDGEFSEKLINMLVSFARDGKPTATWGPQKEWPAQDSKQNAVVYYKLDLENTKLLNDPLAKRRKFWDDLSIYEHAKMSQDKTREEL